MEPIFEETTTSEPILEEQPPSKQTKSTKDIPDLEQLESKHNAAQEQYKQLRKCVSNLRTQVEQLEDTYSVWMTKRVSYSLFSKKGKEFDEMLKSMVGKSGLQLEMSRLVNKHNRLFTDSSHREDVSSPIARWNMQLLMHGKTLIREKISLERAERYVDEIKEAGGDAFYQRSITNREAEEQLAPLRPKLQAAQNQLEECVQLIDKIEKQIKRAKQQIKAAKNPGAAVPNQTGMRLKNVKKIPAKMMLALNAIIPALADADLDVKLEYDFQNESEPTITILIMSYAGGDVNDFDPDDEPMGTFTVHHDGSWEVYSNETEREMSYSPDSDADEDELLEEAVSLAAGFEEE